MAARANEPFNLRRSDRIDTVIILYFGTSAYSLSYVSLSNRTRLFTFSLLFPLDHFFFLPLLELAAALAMASFDLSGTLGGCFVVFRSATRTFLLRLRYQYGGSAENPGWSTSHPFFRARSVSFARLFVLYPSTAFASIATRHQIAAKRLERALRRTIAT
uniref:Uncharacterized protein n=1 Tax=Picocystis salinarum TaxID=88271 RepID=A0A7S3UFC8_9CHLO